jgi:hypothetical protein
MERKQTEERPLAGFTRIIPLRDVLRAFLSAFKTNHHLSVTTKKPRKKENVHDDERNHDINTTTARQMKRNKDE